MQDSFHIILMEPRYDGNIGSVARVMKNFGFKNLVLVKAPEIGAEGRKSAMHARDIMDSALRLDSFGELTGRFDYLVGTSAKVAGDANHLRTPVFPEELNKALDAKGKIGLVFGREDFGLLNEELELCDVLLTIPANHEYPTLNLSHSVAVLLYELSKEANKQKAGRKLRPLNATEKEYMLKFYDELIDGSYIQEFENRLAKRTFRQIVGRAFVSGREAKTMTGVFRHVKGKVGKN
jgi:tRNA/rRNA methyltransferase